MISTCMGSRDAFSTLNRPENSLCWEHTVVGVGWVNARFFTESCLHYDGSAGLAGRLRHAAIPDGHPPDSPGGRAGASLRPKLRRQEDRLPDRLPEPLPGLCGSSRTRGCATL